MGAEIITVDRVGGDEWEEWGSSISTPAGTYVSLPSEVADLWDRGIREAKQLGLSGEAFVAHRHAVFAAATA